ncbi:MAG TPA: S8 family serine peptidase [Actinomycetota bacterium]|nr:S8 family serine peptidase [Actinomycetota bacterium]
MSSPNRSPASKVTITVLTLLAAVSLLFFALPATAVTNDPYFVCPGQWGLDRVGGEWAWAKSKGAGVIIATVDSGVDLSHYDLKGTDKLLPGNDYIQNDSSADDEHGHGTLIAGVAAARTSNGEGIAAIAPDAMVLPVKVFNAQGEANADDVADGIQWAVDEGERLKKPLVLNLSFTGIDPDEGVVDQLLTPGVLSAINNAASRGAAVVVASGNDGESTTAYDATRPGIAVVGAIGKDDKRATFSNHGLGLDLVAPGVEVISTYWHKDRGSVVASTTGTSISVPFVAGAAALLMSPSGGGLTNTAAIQRLLDTAEDIGPANEYGQGLLDVSKALGVKRETPTAPCPKPPRKTTVASVPSPTPSPSPSPTASPSPLLLPPPGEPPVITQEGAVTGLAQGPEDSGNNDAGPFSEPLRPVAGALVGLVALMHAVRRFLLI